MSKPRRVRARRGSGKRDAAGLWAGAVLSRAIAGDRNFAHSRCLAAAAAAMPTGAEYEDTAGGADGV
jgi:hypothetical protein